MDKDLLKFINVMEIILYKSKNLLLKCYLEEFEVLIFCFIL